MKIVIAKEFRAMPAGTVFHHYEPHISGTMGIKGETFSGNDFWEQSLDGVCCLRAHNTDEMCSRLDEMKEKGASYPVDLNCEGRDGLFDDAQLFLVWERADVEALIARLGAALKAVGK